MKATSCVSVCFLLLGACAVHAQSPTVAENWKNSVGMDFVLVNPGTMQVGVFHPECPNPNAPAPGGARPGGTGGAGGQGQGGPGNPAASGAAGTLGAPPAGGNAAPRPQRDPRAAWSADDYAKCAELVKQDSSDGFTVKIAAPYYIGKYEVTQAQWQRVMGNNPSIFQGDKVTGDASNHPVDNVKWDDVQRFVKKLNEMEHTSTYHLPTEFQWEYACRAGGAGQESWADIRVQAVQGIGGGFGAAAATGGAASPRHPTTEPVASKQPNAWGIYDMLGNVWEWVADPYNGKLFADPKPDTSGTNHVLKGGGFASDVKNTICATHGAGPGDRWDVGFRVEKDLK